jgi:hypothetical protein
VPANGANTYEFRGVGKLNGLTGHEFHVCVQDNAEPGAGADRLHLRCETCAYNTQAPYSTEIVMSGNLRVISSASPPAPGGTPSTVSAEPSLVPGLVTVTVQDANGAVLSGVPVKLTGVSLLPLNGVTNALGQAVFVVNPLSSGVAKATAGGVAANPVKLGP